MKKTYTIQTAETTDIHTGEGVIGNLDTLLAKNNYSSFLFLSDVTTNKLFGSQILQILQKLGKPVETHVLTKGEESKNTTNLFRILEHLVERGFDRKSAVVALGGGMVGDIATTVAGLYHRGIDCIQIPTTLLAQVDAAIGGKGAVNLRNYKNVIGVIKQPRLVIIDPTLLEKLPEDQYKSGMGEVIKYAIAMDKDLFKRLINFKDKDMTWVIDCSVSLKMSIVQKDPHEKTGLRQVLNFGHTVGHAIELYAHLSHGEAISIGMTFAIKVSQRLKMLADKDAKIAIDLIDNYKLPTTIAKKLITKNVIYDHMQKDKKAVDGIPTFVLLEDIGKAKVGCTISKETIDEILKEILV